MRVQLCNFLSSFILILGDRFSPFRAFFYILPLLGVAFAQPSLQSLRLTGGPTQRKPMKWNYVYGALLTLHMSIQQYFHRQK